MLVRRLKNNAKPPIPDSISHAAPGIGTGAAQVPGVTEEPSRTVERQFWPHDTAVCEKSMREPGIVVPLGLMVWRFSNTVTYPASQLEMAPFVVFKTANSAELGAPLTAY